MIKVLIIDNYDSFTFNLKHQVESILQKDRKNYNIFVLRNDDPNLLTILKEKISAFFISPGPMTPKETGYLNEIFKKIVIKEDIPTFGVCLGFQFLSYFFGIDIYPSKYPKHGQQVDIYHNSEYIFSNLPSPFKAARYNSLQVSFKTNNYINYLAYEIISKEEKIPMALKVKNKPFFGVQFHPESFLTENGDKIIKNFFKDYVYRSP